MDDMTVPPRVWNAIAHAANVVFDRPLFSRRRALVVAVVESLAEAGYEIVPIVDHFDSPPPGDAP